MKLRIDGDFSIQKGPFSNTLESLTSGFRCPEWFKDAKIGFWSHWGPQSVPMYGDWYARRMYLEGDPVYYYHWRKYGHPSKFGYKDLLPLWKAERFDPEALTDLFYRAGARYMVAQAVHHDNFDNFDSTYQPNFNSVNMGPHRDIVGEWKQAAEARGMHFGISEHLAGSPGFFLAAKGCDSEGPYRGIPYDGCLPEFSELYYDETNTDMQWEKNWFCSKEEFHKHFFLRMKDAIDKYKPDLYYTDGPVPCGQYGIDLITHLYNANAALHNGENQAVFCQKDKTPSVFPLGILDIERSQEDKKTDYYWQSDTSIGDWFYNLRDVYKPWNTIVEMIIDVVSKNGNVLLACPQLPDGQLDEECTWILEQIAGWMDINGEGIFATRPWRTCGEGPTQFEHKGHIDENPTEWQPANADESAVAWKAGDIRFTQKGDALYAFQMRWPGKNAIIRSLPLGQEEVQSVELLGVNGTLPFEQTGAGLVVTLPDGAPCKDLSCLKIMLKSRNECR